MPPVRITDTTLRDGHQSLWATRMRTKEMLPIVEKLDQVGYFSLEVWGGATFDVCLRYLGEDPWERLRLLKKAAQRTPLQMLLRGQSLVGYAHYPDDVVEAFVDRAVANGIDIIRIFDALNDVRNMTTAIRAAKRAGAHVQATVVYTLSPVHTVEHYVATAVELADLGADSICIKDMAGMLAPYRAFELVSTLKRKLSIPVQLHCHYIGGMAVGAYLKAAEAGVDVIDTASVPLAFGASQPPAETVVRALRETPYDTGLDIRLLFEIAQYFEDLRKERGFERGVTRIHDMRVFDHQVPGGMISNLVSQLNEQRALHRLEEVLAEIPRVRAELGYPPLVTPTSQIVGTQAVLNVLTGQRYKLIPGEVKNYVAGLYGRPPGALDPEIARKVLGDREPVTCRPADLLEPRMEKMREEIGDLAQSEEDILSYVLFPQVARKFLEARAVGQAPSLADGEKLRPGSGQKTAGPPNAKEEGRKKMNLEEIRELIRLLDETDITEFSLESQGMRIAIKKGVLREAVPPSQAEVQSGGPPIAPADTGEEAPDGAPVVETFTVVAPMVGTFYRAPAPDAPPYVDAGDMVREGQVLCIIEAMKLMNEIEAEVAGEVLEILADNGQTVEYGQPLFVIAKKQG
ncbi:MAG: acetyl-CoA carboxylase biotin carboxyl carrier protein [Thermoanaerobacterales bacterium]|nr:acetyl-CoA carboxylase biotin carboxyl carrier protein [Bacillota bacterium]MDI6906765.1 acetyl-CoA carboxylase biotin carboxyl carrier protein [Thermoanaerobacterales bacterium]